VILPFRTSEDATYNGFKKEITVFNSFQGQNQPVAFLKKGFRDTG